MRTRIALTAAVAVTTIYTFACAQAPAAQAAITTKAVAPGDHRTAGFGAFPLVGTLESASAPTTASKVPRAHWADLLETSAKAPPPPPPATDATSTDTPDWQCIRVEESGDTYNDPAKPSGAYGILKMTWQSNGFDGWPYQAPPALQDSLALKLYHEFGWVPWSSRFACGL